MLRNYLRQRDALLAHGVPAAQVACVPEETEAIEAALRWGQPGDVLLIFVDQITRSWKQVVQFQPDAGPRPEPSRPAYFTSVRSTVNPCLL